MSLCLTEDEKQNWQKDPACGILLGAIYKSFCGNIHGALCDDNWIYTGLDWVTGESQWLMEVNSVTEDRDFCLKCIGFRDTTSAGGYLILSALNLCSDRVFEQTVLVQIPHSFIDLTNVRFRQTYLDESSEVYKAVRQDLEQEGMICSHKFSVHSSVVEGPVTAACAERDFLVQNRSRYKQLILALMQDQLFGGMILSSECGFILEIRVRTPLVTVIRMDKEMLI